jgi:hypothetical protein
MSTIKESRVSAVKTAIVITLCFIVLLALSATAKPYNRYIAKVQRKKRITNMLNFKYMKQSKLRCPHTAYAI